MRYAKLINQYPQFAPNPILHNELWYGNPPAEIYEAEGYKPVQFADYPEQDPPEGYYWAEAWSEDETMVYQSWQAASLDPEEQEVT